MCKPGASLLAFVGDRHVLLTVNLICGGCCDHARAGRCLPELGVG